MARPLSVLISGAGIGAASLSHWLLRSSLNVRITIVERAPSLRLSGAAVDIRSSAVDIMRWMDLEADIRAHGTKEEGMQFVQENGKEIATLRASGNTDTQSLTSEFEIMRGDLCSIMFAKIQHRLTFVFNDTIDSYAQRSDGSGVDVTFSKTKEVENYDIVVGADGLGSKTRCLMLNSKARDHIYDEGVHVAYFNVDKDLLDGSKLAKGRSVPGGRVMYIRPHSEAGKVSVLLLQVTTKNDVAMKARLNKALEGGNEAYMALMDELYHDFGWLASEVLKGMREPGAAFYCSLFGQTRCPKLQDKRVALLGDAGYAAPGAGTSLAITGGYVLAGELMNHPNDVPAALRRYEELMVPFVKAQQGVGSETAMQWLNPQTQVGINIRDSLLWFMTKSRLIQLMMFVGPMVGFTEKKMDMPDYSWADSVKA